MEPNLTRYDPPHSPGMSVQIDGKPVSFVVDHGQGLIYYQGGYFGATVSACVTGVLVGEWPWRSNTKTKKAGPVRNKGQNYLSLRKEKY